MLLLISPAKTLDFEPIKDKTFTEPRLLGSSSKLVKILKKQSPADLRQLMGVSEKIAQLNHGRFKSFKVPFTLDNAKQAIYAFKGDVYVGLDAASFNKSDLKFAQKHLRILSGLYGVLRPMDLMQPYRLEMGTKLANKAGKNLYAFWDESITQVLEEDIKANKEKVVVNLASKEYFSSIKKKDLSLPILNIHFKEERNGVYKIIAFSAKKARGMMCNYVIKNRITKVNDLKGFDMADYCFNEEMSSELDFVFTR